jgi:hypothetical protein
VTFLTPNENFLGFALYYTYLITVRNFTTLAQTVASNWRVVDAITLSYCKLVAQLLKERHAELTQDSKGLRKMTKKKITSSAAEERTVLSISLTEEESIPYRHNPCSTSPFNKDSTTLDGPMPCSAVTPVASLPTVFHDNSMVYHPQECAFVQRELNCPRASMRTQLDNLPAISLYSASNILPVQVAPANNWFINGNGDDFEDLFGVDFEDKFGNF